MGLVLLLKKAPDCCPAASILWGHARKPHLWTRK